MRRAGCFQDAPARAPRGAGSAAFQLEGGPQTVVFLDGRPSLQPDQISYPHRQCLAYADDRRNQRARGPRAGAG